MVGTRFPNFRKANHVRNKSVRLTKSTELVSVDLGLAMRLKCDGFNCRKSAQTEV